MKFIISSITLPSSKSITNRALLITALAKGKSEIINPLLSDDTKYMIQALKKLGVKIVKQGKNFVIYGNNGKFDNQHNRRDEALPRLYTMSYTLNPIPYTLFLGNAGTATRFLTSTCACLANLPIRITGDKRMQERPISDLVDGLKQLGAEITFEKENDCPPIIIEKPLIGGICKIKGDKSSQYFSSILLSATLAKKDITIKVIGNLVSKPYIDQTIEIMKTFGVKVKNKNYKEFFIKSGQKYKSQKYEIEGDASSSTYFGALSALHNKEITINNLSLKSKQADIKFFDVLKKMGCKIRNSKHLQTPNSKLSTNITIIGPKQLKPLGTINLNDMPDGAMTVAILCAFAKGKSILKGLENLRIKETNRLKALSTELKKIGCDALETNDGLIINGNPDKLHGAEIETYNDHRMAMCFGIVGTKIQEIIIKNPSCVSKTYPNFWKDLKKITNYELRITNIVLIGMRGSGKTTVGKLLATELNRKFIDLDKEIEKNQKMTTKDIVSHFGWPHFRKIEQKICANISKSNNLVIATGGGAVMNNKNVRNLKKNGILIFLYTDIKTLTKRLKNFKNRPSLKGKKTFLEELNEVWKERKKTYYKIADKVIDTNLLKTEKIANEIIKKIILFFNKNNQLISKNQILKISKKAKNDYKNKRVKFIIST